MSVRSIGVSFLLAIAMYVTWFFMKDQVSFSLKAKRKLNREQRKIRLTNEQELLFEEQRRWNEKMKARERASNQTRSDE